MEQTQQELEVLRAARQNAISPYIAQGYDVEADFPNERRITLTREKKLRIGWLIFGLIFYLIPGIIYLIYWYATKKEEKTILY